MLLTFIYIAFIGLGLPDSLLGASWPSMYESLGASISVGGFVSTIIAIGTTTSSLGSDKLHRWLGTGKLVAISVSLTAVAMFGFATSTSFWQICLWAVPYGLGAGSIDVALNNYVAVHYHSKHMSWLHCMWGVGTIAGPFAVRNALALWNDWHMGYMTVGVVQTVLTVLMIISLPLWKKTVSQSGDQEPKSKKGISIFKALSIPGVPQAVFIFICYCALEASAMMWAGSYLVEVLKFTEEAAAGLTSLFFIGLTAGRGVNGFLTLKFSDKQLIRLGELLIGLGALLMLLPVGSAARLVGLAIIGLGCAPIYPCSIHATPKQFGTEHSQLIIGLEATGAYIGVSLMPPLFGVLSKYVGMKWLPIYILIILLVLIYVHESLVMKAGSIPQNMEL